MITVSKSKWPIAIASGLVAASIRSACSSSGSKTPSASDTSSTSGTTPAAGTSSTAAGIDVGSGTLTAHKMKNIAFILNYDLSATYSVAMVAGAKAAGKKNGVNLDIKFDKLDAPTELANYQSVLTSGKYDGVIIQPLSSQLCQPIASDAVKDNLPWSCRQPDL